MLQRLRSGLRPWTGLALGLSPGQRVAAGAAVTPWGTSGPFEAVRLSPTEKTLLQAGSYLLDVRLEKKGIVPRDAHLVPIRQGEAGRARRIALLPEGGDRVASLLDLDGHADALELRHEAGERLPIGTVSLRRLSRAEVLMRLSWRLLRERAGNRRQLAATLRNAGIVLRERGLRGIADRLRVLTARSVDTGDSDYARWIERYDRLDEADIAAIESRIGMLASRPLVSILAVAKGDGSHARGLMEDLKAQLYGQWELCLALPEDAGAVTHQLPDDMRIRIVRSATGSRHANLLHEALAAASGSHVAFLAPEDRLPRHALFLVASAIAARPDAAIVYTDEDEIDAEGLRRSPRFKGEPDDHLLAAVDMLGTLTAIDRRLAIEAGGIGSGEPGDLEHGLVLRSALAAASRPIVHVPFIACHRATVARRRAMSEADGSGSRIAAARAYLAARGMSAEVAGPDGRGGLSLRFTAGASPPSISILIPTRDHVGLLRTCIESIRARTRYPRHEVLVIDNGSREPETLEYLAGLQSDPRMRVVAYDKPFNYSAINNYAARLATGDLLCLLNNDTEVIAPDWLDEMAGLALHADAGAVGAKLLYSDDTIQHAGVVLGLGGGADHAFKHMSGSAPGHAGLALYAREVSAVTAACLLVRRSLYLETGGLDEDAFPVAFNDIDFCLRLRAAGYRNLWSPRALLYHHESRSRGSDDRPGRREQFLREVASLKARWPDAIGHDPFYSPNLSLETSDFRPAFPPRVRRFWRAGEG